MLFSALILPSLSANITLYQYLSYNQHFTSQTHTCPPTIPRHPRADTIKNHCLLSTRDQLPFFNTRAEESTKNVEENVRVGEEEAEASQEGAEAPTCTSYIR